MAVVIILGGSPVPLNVTASPKRLADANVQSTIINPAVDAAGNPAKLSFFGGVPVAQPIPVGNTHTVAAGSGTQVFVNTTFDGGVGTSAYTIGDIVAAIKELNLGQISPGGFVVPAAPVLVSAPTISDPNSSPAVGDLLTATHGTYSGSVSSYNGQWYSGASPIALATGLTYTVQNSDLGNAIVYTESASNLGGSSAIGTSNSLGPIITGMATPTLTNYSALGAAPVTLQWSDTDYTVGLYGQLQIATDSGFSSITQNIVFFIDGSSWANLNESIGLVTPSGTYYARIRACRDNDSGSTTVTGTDPSGNAVSFTADVSPWSNTFTDTINVATTVLSTPNNTTNSSQYVNVSSGTYGANLHAIGTNGVGAFQSVRANAAKTGKKQFDVKLTALVDQIAVTVEDRTTVLNSGYPLIGQNNSAGISFIAYIGGWQISYGSAAHQTGSITWANGDIVSAVFDTVAGTAAFFRNGTQIGTTVTGLSFSAWNACVAMHSNDQVDVNFGQSALTSTGTGATMYG